MLANPTTSKPLKFSAVELLRAPNARVSRAVPWRRSVVGLLVDFGLHELCEFVQGLLPSKVTSLRRDYVGHAFLFDIDFGANRNGLQAHSDTHLAWQIRVIKSVRVNKALSRHEFGIDAAKRMAHARREISERHSVAATHLRLQFMDRADEAVRGEPARHRIALQEGAIYFLWLGSDYAVESDCIGHAVLLLV
jgi:hypothetical protein